MSRKSQGTMVAPVGDSIDNGFDNGGSRFYPWSSGFAITPPAYYSDYIGPATGLPVSVPAGSLPDTIGSASAPTSQAAITQATAHPFGRTSPLPWAIAGLVGGVAALWATHYKEGGGRK